MAFQRTKASFSPDSPPPDQTARIVVALTLFVITLALYTRTGTFNFVNYDDPLYVSENAAVQSGLNAASIKWAWTTSYGGNWHPLAWISHMADAAMWGNRPGGHHLTSIYIHTATVLILWAWLRRASGNLVASAIVAAIFAWHPLHVESVAWISERKDVLCGFFFVLGLYSYAGYAKSPGWIRYLAVTLCFVLAMLSKPMAVSFPVVALLTDLWPHERTSETRSTSSIAVRRVVEKLPWFAASAAFCFVTYVVQQSGESTRSLASVPLWLRFENAIVSYGTYMLKTFLPIDLAVFYPYFAQGPSAATMATSIVVLVVATSMATIGAKKRPHTFVGWFWFLVMLLPVIGIVQVGNQAMADRYMYLPQIGLSIAIVWPLCDFASRCPAARRSLAPLAAAAIAGMIALSWRQIGVWHDSITLFEHAVHATDYNATAYTNLGHAYLERKEFDKSVAASKQAIAIDPAQINAVINLGVAFLEQKAFKNAEIQFRNALAIQPEHPVAHFNLGVSLDAQARLDEAAKSYVQATKLNPRYALAFFRLGACLVNAGRPRDAVDAYQEFVKLEPRVSGGWTNLAMALAASGSNLDAIDPCRRALELDPANVETRYLLAQSLWLCGDSVGAEKELDVLANTAPEHAAAKVLRARIHGSPALDAR